MCTDFMHEMKQASVCTCLIEVVRAGSCIYTLDKSGKKLDVKQVSVCIRLLAVVGIMT